MDANQVEDFEGIVSTMLLQPDEYDSIDSIRRPITKSKGYFTVQQVESILELFSKSNIRIDLLTILVKRCFRLSCLEASVILQKFNGRRDKSIVIELLAPIISDPFNYQVMFEMIPFPEEQRQLEIKMDQITFNGRQPLAPAYKSNWVTPSSITKSEAHVEDSHADNLLSDFIGSCKGDVYQESLQLPGQL